MGLVGNALFAPVCLWLWFGWRGKGRGWGLVGGVRDGIFSHGSGQASQWHHCMVYPNFTLGVGPVLQIIYNGAEPPTIYIHI